MGRILTGQSLSAIIAETPSVLQANPCHAVASTAVPCYLAGLNA
jgi:hypothetical protein